MYIYIYIICSPHPPADLPQRWFLGTWGAPKHCSPQTIPKLPTCRIDWNRGGRSWGPHLYIYIYAHRRSGCMSMSVVVVIITFLSLVVVAVVILVINSSI